jgi:hypothetical protein
MSTNATIDLISGETPRKMGAIKVRDLAVSHIGKIHYFAPRGMPKLEPPLPKSRCHRGDSQAISASVGVHWSALSAVHRPVATGGTAPPLHAETIKTAPRAIALPLKLTPKRKNGAPTNAKREP